MKVTPYTRETVFDRDHYKCAVCGDPSGIVVHHRINRGMGGDPKGVMNRLSNLLTLCTFCNGAAESLPSFAESCRRDGVKLRHGVETLKVPVRYGWTGEWRLLDDDGNAMLVGEVLF